MYVEFIPRELNEGVLYISKQFKTASHLCCCGCGTKIVTPLRPTEYSLTGSGDAVSLYGLIAALISVVIITGVTAVGTKLSTTFTTLSTKLK